MQNRGNKLLVCIPAYNEAKRIGDILGALLHVNNYNVLVINDGSTDNTSSISKNAGAHVITHIKNMGYGSALLTGLLYAYKNNYDYIIFIDGDGQHEISGISSIFKELDNNNYNYVIGSRFLNNDSYKMQAARKLGKVFFSNIIKLFTGLKITDPTSGFIGMNKTVINLLSNFSDFPNDYPDANLIIYLNKNDIRIKEVGVRMFQNDEGKSMHSGFKPIFYFIKVLYSSIIYGLKRL